MRTIPATNNLWALDDAVKSAGLTAAVVVISSEMEEVVLPGAVEEETIAVETPVDAAPEEVATAVVEEDEVEMIAPVDEAALDEEMGFTPVVEEGKVVGEVEVDVIPVVELLMGLKRDWALFHPLAAICRPTDWPTVLATEMWIPP